MVNIMTFIGNMIGLLIADTIIFVIALAIAEIFFKNPITLCVISGAVDVMVMIIMLIRCDFDEYFHKSSVVVSIILIIITTIGLITSESEHIKQLKEKQDKTITDDDLKKSD